MKMLDVNTFKSDLEALDEEQLDEMADILLQERKYRYDKRQVELSKQWRIGDTVYFMHRGVINQAVIKRLNRKTISAIAKDARGATIRWKLSYDYCHKSEGAARAAK